MALFEVEAVIVYHEHVTLQVEAESAEAAEAAVLAERRSLAYCDDGDKPVLTTATGDSQWNRDIVTSVSLI